MGLIKNIFKRIQKKNNLQTSIAMNSTHSSTIKTNNFSCYAILKRDHFDAAAKFQAHRVYKTDVVMAEQNTLLTFLSSLQAST
jgi:hypothetical protein